MGGWALRMENELKLEITRRSRGLLEPFVADATLEQSHQREMERRSGA
jgi:hypothetical protein